jgi:hypothetical protein
MTLGTRPSAFGRDSAAIAFLLAAIFVAGVALARPSLVAELVRDRDYEGAVQSVVFDASGDAWMATRQALYRVRDGKSQRVDAAAGKYDQLALAPGGGLYARLVAGRGQGGLFTVELVQIPQKPIAKLRLPDFPFGFKAVYLGRAGRLIVTVSPLDGPERLDGDFLYVFWSGEGKILAKVTLEGLRSGVVDVGGDALLLLGGSDAIAFSRVGKQLWKLDGKFRNGVLAASGTVALLNPAAKKSIREVHVFQNGTVTPLTMRSPVYDLALAADGSDGAVAIDEGELFFVTPRSCERQQCALRAASRLPIEGTFLISAMRFTGPTTVAIGVINRVGATSPFTYPSAAALAVNTSGKVLFRTGVTLEQPATWAPSIDVTYGVQFFAAHTQQRALIVRLDRE